MDASISIDRIREATGVIDPVFLRSPQYVWEPLSDQLGVTTVLKVESINPIRSFKGRGTDFLLHRLAGDRTGIVCASAGNFGQGMAYACRKRGRPLTVFAARGANRMKVDRMRALGARVELQGDDFDEAKDAAKRHAAENGELYVEDGRLGAIAEGAGTIAVELMQDSAPLDAVFVPLGNGSLVNGIGTWLKQVSPTTRVIAVCADTAPSMALSWRAHRPVVAPSSSIADGIAVRVPVPEAVDIMASTVDAPAGRGRRPRRGAVGRRRGRRDREVRPRLDREACRDGDDRRQHDGAAAPRLALLNRRRGRRAGGTLEVGQIVEGRQRTVLREDVRRRGTQVGLDQARKLSPQVERQPGATPRV